MLINGNGRTPNGPDMPMTVINVEQGKRYRFRLINMACEMHFNFSIYKHSFTVIEADGVNTQPIVADSLPIYAGMDEFVSGTLPLMFLKRSKILYRC